MAQNAVIKFQQKGDTKHMSWHTIYDKVIAPIRDFLGLAIEWIDRIFWPWTKLPEEQIPWEER